MAKILTKKWKDYKSKKPMCLLSVEDRKKIRSEKKARSDEHRQKAEEIKDKKREYFQMLKQKKENKKTKKAKKAL